MKIRTMSRFILLTLATSVLIIPFGLVNTFAATTVSVSHFAGYGGAGITDGPASSAQFIKPAAVTFDKDDNAYVVDQGGIRKITPSGYVSTIYKFSVNGTTSFCSINLDKKDVLWIVDCPGTMVMRISTAGNLVNQFSLYTGNNGWIWNDHGAGFLPDGRLLIPVWYVGKILAVSETGQVSDYFANTISGNCNGSPRPVGLICPSGLAVSDSGEVLVYMKVGSGYNQLPLTYYPTENYSTTLEVNTYVGGVTILAQDSDLTQGNNPGEQTFKIVVIAASQLVKHPEVDLTNYKEVKNTFNIID